MDASDSARAVEGQLEREMELVIAAIRMVAAGGAPRVTVGGLRLGDQILDAARDMARQAGVRIVPRWTTDESGVDIAVERVG